MVWNYYLWSTLVSGGSLFSLFSECISPNTRWRIKGSQDIYICTSKHRLELLTSCVTKSSSLLRTNSRWESVSAKLIPLIWGWGSFRGFKIHLKWSWGLKRLLCFWRARWIDEWSPRTNVRGTIILRVLQIYYSSELMSLSWVTAGLRRILLSQGRSKCGY